MKKVISKIIGSILTIISPRLNTEIMYLLKFRKKLNLKNPQTFDEKILWLKLNSYYKNPLIVQCADKYKVREYIKSQGCESILNELYGVYDTVDDIPWDTLPNKFVLKWNFGAGFNIICKDKMKLNIEDIKKTLKKWGKENAYLHYSEMQYKYIEKKIICEKLLESNNGQLPEDYKLYCFNGIVKYLFICIGRENEAKTKFYFFDRNWNLQRINKDGINAPNNFKLPKPKGLEELYKYAKILSKPFPFVRADFYLIDGKVYFGELTFTPCGGMDTSRLPETDVLFGTNLKL